MLLPKSWPEGIIPTATQALARDQGYQDRPGFIPELEIVSFQGVGMGTKLVFPLTGGKGRIITNSTVLPSQGFANATHVGKPDEITSSLEMGGFIYHLLILP